MNENQYYDEKYAESVRKHVATYTAYRIIRAFKEETKNYKIKGEKIHGTPEEHDIKNWFGINILVSPKNSKVFIEIDFSQAIKLNSKYNLEQIWKNFMFWYEDSFRKDIAADVEISSYKYNFGTLNEPFDQQGIADETVDMGYGPDRIGNTGPIPDFLFDHYYWNPEKQGYNPTMEDLVRNREMYLNENETHMWPEVTMANYNKDKNVDSRPYMSIWAVGYWKSFSGVYEIIEDRTILDTLIKNDIAVNGEESAKNKYNQLRFAIDDIKADYNITSKDFDRDVLPDAYRDYESKINEVFGSNFNFVDTSEKVYYKIFSY